VKGTDYFVLSVLHPLWNSATKEFRPEAKNVSLQMKYVSEEKFHEVAWSRCVTSQGAYKLSTLDSDHIINDRSVFVLNALGDDLKGRAVPLFSWENNHQPSSKAVGVSLLSSPLEQGEIDQTRVEDRFSAWGTHKPYVSMSSLKSREGQSGTGLTDKKQRLVAILTGNARGKDGREFGVAVLAKSYLPLLENTAIASFKKM
jgi:hypothetical protein